MKALRELLEQPGASASVQVRIQHALNVLRASVVLDRAGQQMVQNAAREFIRDLRTNAAPSDLKNPDTPQNALDALADEVEHGLQLYTVQLSEGPQLTNAEWRSLGTAMHQAARTYLERPRNAQLFQRAQDAIAAEMTFLDTLGNGNDVKARKRYLDNVLYQLIDQHDEGTVGVRPSVPYSVGITFNAARNLNAPFETAMDEVAVAGPRERARLRGAAITAYRRL